MQKNATKTTFTGTYDAHKNASKDEMKDVRVMNIPITAQLAIDNIKYKHYESVVKYNTTIQRECSL